MKRAPLEAAEAEVDDVMNRALGEAAEAAEAAVAAVAEVDGSMTRTSVEVAVAVVDANSALQPAEWL